MSTFFNGILPAKFDFVKIDIASGVAFSQAIQPTSDTRRPFLIFPVKFGIGAVGGTTNTRLKMELRDFSTVDNSAQIIREFELFSGTITTAQAEQRYYQNPAFYSRPELAATDDLPSTKFELGPSQTILSDRSPVFHGLPGQQLIVRCDRLTGSNFELRAVFARYILQDTQLETGADNLADITF